jgi:ketosteroid isomerase-like protein
MSDPLTTFHSLPHAILDERDVDSFMALWADDDDVAMWGSELDERAEGRERIRALGEALASWPEQLTFTWDDTFVRVEGDVAWVNAVGAINGSPYRLTAVLVRRAGEWRWHTFHGSEPR